MENESRASLPDDLIAKSRVREEYGLTEGQIRLLGEPDLVKRNPHYRKGAPMRLYSRERVERWIEANQALLAKGERRREAAERAVETKRTRTRELLAQLLGGLTMAPAPSRRRLVEEVELSILMRYGSTPEEISEKAICSHLRHCYTNYEDVLATVEGRVGMGEFYYALKALLCCRIVEHYGLKVDPLVAAFGSVEEAPESLQDDDPEVAARQVLGLEAGYPAQSGNLGRPFLRSASG